MCEHFKSLNLLKIILVYLELNDFLIFTVVFDEENFFFVSSNLESPNHLRRLALNPEFTTV